MTNVVLFDKEKDGVVSVRFKDEESALACVKVRYTSLTSSGSLMILGHERPVLRWTDSGGLHIARE